MRACMYYIYQNMWWGSNNKMFKGEKKFSSEDSFEFVSELER